MVEDARVVVENRKVELAPDELFDEDVDLRDGGGWGLRFAFDDFGVDRADGYQAVAKVLGEARGAVERWEIPSVLVAVDGVEQSCFEAGASCFFATGEDMLGCSGELPVVEGWEWLAGEAGGGGKRDGFTEWARLGTLQPLIGVGGVDFVGLLALGENLIRVVECHVVEGMAGNAHGLAEGFYLQFELFAVGVGRAVEANRDGMGLANQLFEPAERVSGPDDQAAIEGLEVLVEGEQRLAKEMLAIGAGP